jgi:GNAT superfamily N-acetyltransferase/catechol 2,3-dioxygenase-like lactoylglutathione lyase family enzyme
MIFKTTVPILYSTDVVKSLAYYVDVLGFESKWEWGNPTDFGGVNKNSVEIYFCLNAMGQPGTWLCLWVDDVDTYYDTIKAKGAKILSPPETMEWGMREMIVEDPDGHRIRFGQGASISDNKITSTSLPASVRISSRMPDINSMQQLALELKQDPKEMDMQAVLHGFFAEDSDSGKLIGYVFLLSDGPGYYNVRNLFVHPDWRNKRVGSALMQKLTDWLEENASNNAFICLHTGEYLANFYKQFGFGPAFGMFRIIRRKEK